VREVSTSVGTVRVKLGKLGERVVQVSPEYEDCKKLAQERGVPVRIVYFEAQKAAEAVAGTRGDTSWRA
jgi:pyridinium-3,5-bisthiocarboxylic acid mononucleotide nickel chelatase